MKSIKKSDESHIVKPSQYASVKQSQSNIKRKVKNEKRSTLSNAPSDILSAWIALEVLSPQSYSESEYKKKYPSLKNAKLPWDIDGEISQENDNLY